MLISRISGGAIWWNAIFRPAGQGFSDGFGYANVRESYSLIVFFPDLGHRVPSFGSTTGPELSYSNNFPIAFNHPSYCVCPSCARSKREHFEHNLYDDLSVDHK